MAIYTENDAIKESEAALMASIGGTSRSGKGGAHFNWGSSRVHPRSSIDMQRLDMFESFDNLTSNHDGCV
jgi:hypothetical protein